MHSYSLENDKNKYSILVILGLTVLIYNIILEILMPISSIIANQISLISLFGIVYYIYYINLWKYKYNPFKLSDFDGSWEGYVKSSYDNKKHNVNLEIEQKWKKIEIILTTDTTRSISQSARISNEGNNDTIIYTYSNKSESNKNLPNHSGTCILHYNNNEDKLSGYYYTNEDRNNHGRIVLNRT